jgi:F0F1-type ATP synthase membrane subunit b/b'
VKKLDYLNNELIKKLDEEKRSKSELLNLKKDYNENLVNLERQVGLLINSKQNFKFIFNSHRISTW